jgi:hypothetical protein
VRTVAFSPDGRTLAAARCDEECVRLWDVLSGDALTPLAGHKDQVLGLAFSPDGRALASVSGDATGLVWDLTGGAAQAPRRQGAEARQALWVRLAARDAGRARRAVWALASAPADSVSLLRARLRPVPASAPRRVARLLAELDAEEFEVRQRAGRELAKLGPDVEPALRKALEGSPSLELRKRLELLLEPWAGPKRKPLPGAFLQTVRAVEVLERARTPEARTLLKALAGGGRGFRQTEEARAALLHLDGKSRP